MAHSEMYEDGNKIHKFVTGNLNEEFAKKFSVLSGQAFANGAIEVRQKIINDNDECVCGSGMRFDLCCKPNKDD